MAGGARAGRARRGWGLALGLALATASALARADFATAVADYSAGRFEAARAEFEQLAALGDGASQFNLGSMFLRGEGVDKNAGTAVGLLQAAAGNGYAQLSAEKLAAMAAALSPAERRTADELIARYGHDALLASVLPEGRSGAGCAGLRPPQPIATKGRGRVATDAPDNVLAVSRVRIGRDGLARDPEMVYASGSGLSTDLVARVLARLVLRARFKPAELDGKPVDVEYYWSFRNIREQDNIAWVQTVLGDSLAKARAGDPQGQFAIGIVAQHQRLEVPPSVGRGLELRAAQAGYAPALYDIGRTLQNPDACADPARALIWLRAAAHEGSAPAEVALARQLLAGQPGANEIDEATRLLHTALASTDSYVMRHALALLATHPALGTPDGAALAAAASRLEHLEHPNEPQALDAVAAGYAAAGQFDQAQDRERLAIKFASSLNWNTQAMERRLASYTARATWRGDLFDVPPRDAPLPPEQPGD